MRLLAAVLTAALGFTACSTGSVPSPAPQVNREGTTPSSPPVPQIAGATPLIPLTRFFASAETTFGYRVSPDGTRLGWLGSHGGRTTLLVSAVAGNERRAIDTHSRRNIWSFVWARDSRRLLYLLDDGGDENFHVHVTSSDRPDGPPRDLTPMAGTRAWIDRVPRSDPDHVVIAWNRRDRSVFDLYRVNLETGAHTVIAENPGDVMGWMTDLEGHPVARLRHVAEDLRVLEVLRDSRWEAVQRFDLEEFNLRLLSASADKRTLWMLSGRARDRAALVRLDIETGVETVVHEDPRLDIEWVVMSPRTGEPLAAFTYPGRQAIHFLDRELGRDLERADTQAPRGLHLVAADDEERLITIEVFTEKGPEHWLVNRSTGERRLLARHPILAFLDRLGRTEPIELRARDGVPLHGYLTRPPDFIAPGPMVLVVHGGHWVRDYWGYDRVIQFLANRG